jgi:hypothetical protein
MLIKVGRLKDWESERDGIEECEFEILKAEA